MPDNVIPPEELDRRRRVTQLVADSSDLLNDLVDRINDLFELADPLDIMHVVKDMRMIDDLGKRFSPTVKDQIAKLSSGEFGERAAEIFQEGASEGVAGVTNFVARYFEKYGKVQEHPLAAVIRKLFDEAPKMEDIHGNPDPTQAPAIPMAMISLVSGASFQGVLSGDPDGVLKMMAPARMHDRDTMIEHFFVIDHVDAISVPRDISTEQRSKIIGA